jgi:hypothetical protein
MKTNTALSCLSLALAATFCMASAQAATSMTKATYDGAKDDIKATYKVAHDQCQPKSGNAKDICLEIVKGQEKVALAHLEYHYSGTEKDRLKLHEAQYEARYDVAKEKCDDLSGDAKDVCVREAKTARDKAKASKKLDEKVSEAFSDAEVSMRKADYKLAKEKCDAQSGDKKDICEASLKSRYPDM